MMLDRLTSNWALKVLALGLAFGVWVSVTGETSIVQDFTPPLDIRLPDDHTLASDAPTTVNVRLRGTETAIRRMDELLLGVRVDLRDGVLGERDVALSARNLTGVPRGVVMEFINPDRLSLVVDRRVRLRLPVEPTFIGQLPDGYAFYGAEVRPKKLVVEGPESELASVQSLATTPLRLDRLTQPVTMTAVAITEGRNVRIADPEPLTVRVIVDATAIERTFSAVRVMVRRDTRRVETTTTPTTVSVTVSGPPYLIDALRPEMLIAVVDIAGLATGRSHRLAVAIDYVNVPVEEHPRITVNIVTPATVDVRVPRGEDTEE